MSFTCQSLDFVKGFIYLRPTASSSIEILCSMLSEVEGAADSCTFLQKRPENQHKIREIVKSVNR